MRPPPLETKAVTGNSINDNTGQKSGKAGFLPCMIV